MSAAWRCRSSSSEACSTAASAWTLSRSDWRCASSILSPAVAISASSSDTCALVAISWVARRRSSSAFRRSSRWSTFFSSLSFRFAARTLISFSCCSAKEIASGGGKAPSSGSPPAANGLSSSPSSFFGAWSEWNFEMHCETNLRWAAVSSRIFSRRSQQACARFPSPSRAARSSTIRAVIFPSLLSRSVRTWAAL